ncbi:hypothetical protein DZF91_00190 [Actinomadura logoneensis]|uniref:Tat pathway signal sequence domain protein n=1 Tax=Actinomadura logoneensis TaxID=2293572 RepID=A0A372JUA9_9ACTN|nr:hypothetical protein [Actinomadura logoneensis]RFU43615.1 hypothetical protein DZF91_00190 [Actinomadura logoneensis]
MRTRKTLTLAGVAAGAATLAASLAGPASAAPSGEAVTAASLPSYCRISTVGPYRSGGYVKLTTKVTCSKKVYALGVEAGTGIVKKTPVRAKSLKRNVKSNSVTAAYKCRSKSLHTFAGYSGAGIITVNGKKYSYLKGVPLSRFLKTHC